ncbi:hypothetical protein L9F63_000198 [Diploptera punctata]|uniref:Uncharacterized protein n=1 Tax=Diploptera punctata TaxID=6984 RepID=A0AAD8AMX3_DIPPU|nr:hypothetical protein L9F63_000198 [Diploptera punctata]
MNVQWPLLTTCEYNENFYDRIILQQGIILNVCYDNEEELPLDFETILQKLKNNKSWNYRSKFIVIIENLFRNKSLDIARKVFEVMWKNSKIINVMTVVYSIENVIETNIFNLSKNHRQETILEIYTWFPYRNGNCREVTNIVLISKYFAQNYTEFSEVDIFPYKIPDDFMGCAMTVLPYGIPPYQITTENIDVNGDIIYEDRGLAFQFLKLFADKFNITLSLQTPIDTFGRDEAISMFMGIEDGSIDFNLGVIINIPLFNYFQDNSIPFKYDTAKVLCPCPKPISRVKRVISIFTPEVWISISVVFLSASLVLWILSNNKQSKYSELRSFRKLSKCFQNSWSNLLGVSVTEMPITPTVRCFFILYTCFCYAINIVFQAYFTTFLIEPGYGKRIETFEEAINTGLKTGITDMMDIIATDSDVDLNKFPSHVDCPNITKCFERVMFEGDMMIATSSEFPYYIALVNGVQDISKVVCFLEEVVFAAQLVIGTHKGNPIIFKLNKVILLNIEIGFNQKHSSLSEHVTKLKSVREIGNVEEYFVFSMAHLVPIFNLLIFGCLFSSIVFILELIIYYRKMSLISANKM